VIGRGRTTIEIWADSKPEPRMFIRIEVEADGSRGFSGCNRERAFRENPRTGRLTGSLSGSRRAQK